MDSLTQLTLGAAVGEATLGRKIGNKAALWGAGFGTLPDLDVIINPFVAEITSLAFHRGLSHSVFVVILAAPLLAGILQRVHSESDAGWRDWCTMIGLVLGTHIVLDMLTSYGTQVFAPISDARVAVPSVFIIDPMYTVPLAVGLLVAFRWKPSDAARRRANFIGLGLSTAYLCLTLGVKLHVEQVFSSSLEAQGKPHTEVFTQPTPFNIILWSGLVQEGQRGTWVGQYSLLDPDDDIRFSFIPKNRELLKGHVDDPAVETLEWFSKGYYSVSESAGGTAYIHDLRFGRTDLGLRQDGRYLFTFRLHADGAGRYVNATQLDPSMQADGQLLRRFVDRIRGAEHASPS